MFEILGSTSSPVIAGSATTPRIDMDADRGAGAASAATAAAREALQRETTSGVEWLPRHAPHRRI
ncbi:hypothetical protein [Patulibacter sp.]|uniref:hypothetical protein n=1 Tax=Patulibacter sp. TaxID=1912859 RepID=UPI002726D079|nr:hypothetical protein [Patulibacter sp.]MDO9408315.1 hypothetical protein [Patulibacter sp.]